MMVMRRLAYISWSVDETINCRRCVRECSFGCCLVTLYEAAYKQCWICYDLASFLVFSRTHKLQSFPLQH